MLEFFTPECVQLPILSETYCNAEEIKAKLEPYNGPFKDLLNDPKYHKGKLLHFYPSDGNNGKKIGGGYRPEEHICPEQDKFQKSYIDYIRKHMVFKDGVMGKVQRRLKSCANKIRPQIRPEEVTYVGVHIRRTDHLRFMNEQHGMEPLGADYYNDAMDYFREEYDNCVFIVASDDMKWTKKKIDKSHNDVYFSNMNPTFHNTQTGILMDDDLSKAAYDLALLSSCNHTVVSRGTYSMWIAMIATGEYYTEYGAIVPPDLQG